MSVKQKAYSAAPSHIRIRRPRNAVPQQVHAKHTIIFTGTFVERLEIETVLERTFANELLLWYVGVVGRHTQGEPEKDFWIRIEVRGAELNDIPKTFTRPVHALYRIVVIMAAKSGAFV